MVDILSELGLDQEDVTWEDLAACRYLATPVYDDDGEVLRDSNGESVIFDPLFDSYENDVEPYTVRKSMDSTCLSCPVQKICYDTGKAGGETGVRGGVYMTNGRQDKTRNSHKTKEVWAAIRERIGKL